MGQESGNKFALGNDGRDGVRQVGNLDIAGTNPSLPGANLFWFIVSLGVLVSFHSSDAASTTPLAGVNQGLPDFSSGVGQAVLSDPPAHSLDGLTDQLRGAGIPSTLALESRLDQWAGLLAAGNALGVVSGLTTMAEEQGASANYRASRVLLDRAVRIEAVALDAGHPALAENLAKQALQIYLSGDSLSALQPALRAENLAREGLRLQLRTLTEKRALQEAVSRISCLDLLITLAAISPEERMAARVWDAVIRSRGLVLDEMASRHRDIIQSQDPRLLAVADSLRSAQSNYAAVLLSRPDSTSRDYPARVLSARKECERLESVIARSSRFHRAAFDRGHAGFDEVKGRLSTGNSLVSYVRYVHYRRRWIKPSPGLVGHAVLDSIPRYAVFVEVPGWRVPKIIPIGDASPIDGVVARWRRLAASPATDFFDAGEHDLACHAVGDTLRSLIWDPVARILPDSQQVTVVADGALQQVNLDALPLVDGRFLIETARFILPASCERDLVVSRGTSSGSISFLAMGGADYDKPPESVPRATSNTPVLATNDQTFRGLVSDCRDVGGLRFQPLPATRAEVEEIARIWKSMTGDASFRTFLGPQASEAAFKEWAPKSRIIHLASHGFFLDNLCPEAQGDSLAIENPLLLSGLAMAGANLRSRYPAGVEDGIMTAEELAGLDLLSADLIVLSACETGLGETRPNEGVFGLRRAMTMAGAGTLVMSLWPVTDQEARAWSKRFYENFLGSGTGVHESVRAANLAGLLRRRSRGENCLPGMWAAFMACGSEPSVR